MHTARGAFVHGGGHADFAPWAPVDRKRGQSPRTAVACQPVQEGVGSRIVPLTAGAEEGCGRGEANEKVQVALERGLVQVLRSRDLGSHSPSKSFRVLLQQDAVVEDAGRVHDAADERPLIRLLEDALYVLAV